MLFASFAHRLLLAFGFFVVVVGTIVATELGMFGEVARSWLEASWAALYGIYEDKQRLFDNAFGAVGFVGSILGAAWTIHRGWHYAERNLPARLNELNERWHNAQENLRTQLAPALEAAVTISPRNVAEPKRLQKLISWFHDPTQRELVNWKENLDRYKAEYRALARSRSRCRTEVLTAHLALGSQLSQLGREQDALDVFEKALRFNSTDIDALELAAKQSFALNLRPRALKHLETMVEAALRRGKPIRQARALRFQAEILHEGQRTDWDEARDKLHAALKILSDAEVRRASLCAAELVLAGIQLSDVQISRERFTAARSALNASEKHLVSLTGSDAHEVVERFRKAKERLLLAEEERENPNIND
jgi:tetratricopeptide (TPR) repeat protein